MREHFEFVFSTFTVIFLLPSPLIDLRPCHTFNLVCSSSVMRIFRESSNFRVFFFKKYFSYSCLVLVFSVLSLEFFMLTVLIPAGEINTWYTPFLQMNIPRLNTDSLCTRLATNYKASFKLTRHLHFHSPRLLFVESLLPTTHTNDIIAPSLVGGSEHIAEGLLSFPIYPHTLTKMRSNRARVELGNVSCH